MFVLDPLKDSPLVMKSIFFFAREIFFFKSTKVLLKALVEKKLRLQTTQESVQDSL